MKTNSDSWSIEKTQNVSEIIAYNLSQQKRFFVDVTLKSSMAHYRSMTFVVFLRHFRLQNGILTAIWWHKKFSVIAIFLGRNGHLRKQK